MSDLFRRVETNYDGEKAQDLARMSIIRLKIRSEVDDVIDGNCTIPCALSVSLTWKQVFEKMKIKFNPDLHMLRAYSTYIEDFNAPIYDLYRTYKRRMEVYYATIVAKPAGENDGRLMKKGKRKSRTQKPSGRINSNSREEQPKKAAVPKRKQNATDNSDHSPPPPPTITKTRATRGHHQPAINNGGTPSSSPSVSGRQHHHPVTSNFRKSDTRNTEETPDGPGGFKPPAGFRMPVPQQRQQLQQQEQPQRAPQRPPPIPTFNRPSQDINLSFRDESTQAGEEILHNETAVKPVILTYFNDHCSNRDMVTMQRELQNLKKLTKFQALNRLVPFTAGILQNAFLDQFANIQ